MKENLTVSEERTPAYGSTRRGASISRYPTTVIPQVPRESVTPCPPRRRPAVVHEATQLRYTDPTIAYFFHVSGEGKHTLYCWSYLAFDFQNGDIRDSDLIVDLRSRCQFPAILIRQVETQGPLQDTSVVHSD
jgi:hypothetical protein